MSTIDSYGQHFADKLGKDVKFIGSGISQIAFSVNGEYCLKVTRDLSMSVIIDMFEQNKCEYYPIIQKQYTETVGDKILFCYETPLLVTDYERSRPMAQVFLLMEMMAWKNRFLWENDRHRARNEMMECLMDEFKKNHNIEYQVKKGVGIAPDVYVDQFFFLTDFAKQNDFRFDLHHQNIMFDNPNTGMIINDPFVS